MRIVEEGELYLRVVDGTVEILEQVAEQATAADFDLPKLAIIIRSVEITRY